MSIEVILKEHVEHLGQRGEGVLRGRRLADAAFGLQDEMNGVLHNINTSLQKFWNAARVKIKRRRPLVFFNLS